jgi:ketosteroid isomerase-like protein
MIRQSAWTVGLVLVFGIFSCVFTLLVAAGTEDSAQQIRQLSSDYRTALLTRNTTFLISTVADDAVNVGIDGRLFDRRALIAKIQDPSFSYRNIEIGGLVVQVIGDIALTSGTAAVTAEASGHIATDTFRFIRIWQRQAGKWQVIYFQATHIQA